jgi:DNA mismatch endonuclease, patch repair protein
LIDTVSPEQRSAIMSRIRGKDTGPEVAVRKILFRFGYRYRLHDRRLPGRPDIVFPGRRKAIFVHGCWWHQHTCRLGRRTPQSRPEYWGPKFQRIRARDKIATKELRKLGWRVLVIWECQCRDSVKIERITIAFLGA